MPIVCVLRCSVASKKEPVSHFLESYFPLLIGTSLDHLEVKIGEVAGQMT